MTKVLYPMSTARRRRWPVFVPAGLVIILAGLWTGFWFFASAKAETTLAGWREREAKSGPHLFLRQADRRRLSVPHRGSVHRSDRRTAQHRAAGRAQGQGSDGRGPGLRPEPGDQRNPGAGDDRRARQAAGLCRQLEARPVERPRHARSSRAGVVRIRSADGRTRRGRRQRHGVPGRARRTARPPGRWLRHRQSDHRPCAVAARRFGAGTASAGEDAVRRRHRREPARPEGLLAQAMARPLPRDPGRQRPDRDRQGARPAGRRDRGRCRQAGALAQRRARRAAPDHGREPRQGAQEARHRSHDVRRPGGIDLRRARQDHAGSRQSGASERAQSGRLAGPAHRAGRQARGGLPLRFVDGAVYLGPFQVGRTPPLF